MSFFAPHSMSTIVKLMGGAATFLSRVYARFPLPKNHPLTLSPRNTYFSKGYFQAGNEPSFELPWVYHYANRPDLSALRVREVVYKNFNTKINGYDCIFSRAIVKLKYASAGFPGMMTPEQWLLCLHST